MVAEQQQRINNAKDYVVQRQCGCRTIFQGEKFHEEWMFIPCSQHCKVTQGWIRDKFVLEAKEELRVAKLRQSAM